MPGQNDPTLDSGVSYLRHDNFFSNAFYRYFAPNGAWKKNIPPLIMSKPTP
jgi:hypothetical protein